MKNILSTALLLSLCFSVANPTLAQKRNGLPPTTMDSFVRQAAGNAENIYGDEGHEGPPPFMYFEYENRINSGIFDIRDKGLTTGHGSYMPSAWGRDEFLGAEWSQSGANGGNPKIGGPGTIQDQNGNPQNGTTTPAQLPYQIGPGWNVVRDPHGNVLGYMAPGETPQQFFSGQSGHLLPGFQDEAGALYNHGNYSVTPASQQAIASNQAAIRAARIKQQQEAQAAAAEAQALQQGNAQSQNPALGSQSDPYSQGANSSSAPSSGSSNSGSSAGSGG